MLSYHEIKKIYNVPQLPTNQICNLFDYKLILKLRTMNQVYHQINHTNTFWLRKSVEWSPYDGNIERKLERGCSKHKANFKNTRKNLCKFSRKTEIKTSSWVI